MKSIRNIVFTPDIEGTNFLNEERKAGATCIRVMDARSAVYVATGICAPNREQVLVCMSAGNDSRSAFSGMTEAYYNNFPIVLVTFGNGLDYSTELKDVTIAHFRVDKAEEIYPLLENKRGPIHIEVGMDVSEKEKRECLKVQRLLSSTMTEQDYLYFSWGIMLHSNTYRCKTLVGGMPNCYDGAFANVLGASLAERRRRYVGVVSEEEAIHDINSLGNINVNNRLAFVVMTQWKNSVIAEYARTQGFLVKCVCEEQLSVDDIDELVNNNQRALLIVIKESS